MNDIWDDLRRAYNQKNDVAFEGAIVRLQLLLATKEVAPLIAKERAGENITAEIMEMRLRWLLS